MILDEGKYCGIKPDRECFVNTILRNKTRRTKRKKNGCSDTQCPWHAHT